MAIGKLLKDLLNDKKMTVKELAEKSGVSVNTLYGIIARDNLTIKPDIAEKISNVLGIDESMLLTKQNKHFSIMEFMQNAEEKESLHKPANIIWETFNQESLMQTRDENLTKLVSCYAIKLNELGKKEAIKRIEELTQIKKYTEPIDTQTENEKEV